MCMTFCRANDCIFFAGEQCGMLLCIRKVLINFAVIFWIKLKQ